MRGALIAKLKRAESTDEGTFSGLTFGSERTYSLELPWRNNRRSISCIPEGVYVVKWAWSPRFQQWFYRVMNVPDRGGILFHPSNLAGDASLGWQAQLEGCISPCERLGRMANRFGKMQAAGLVSAPAVRRLVRWAGWRDFILEVS